MIACHTYRNVRKMFHHKDQRICKMSFYLHTPQHKNHRLSKARSNSQWHPTNLWQARKSSDTLQNWIILFFHVDEEEYRFFKPTISFSLYCFTISPRPSTSASLILHLLSSIYFTTSNPLPVNLSTTILSSLASSILSSLPSLVCHTLLFSLLLFPSLFSFFAYNKTLLPDLLE